MSDPTYTARRVGNFELLLSDTHGRGRAVVTAARAARWAEGDG